MKKWLIGAGVVAALLLVAAWMLRVPLSRLVPIRHEGSLARIESFHKGGFDRQREGTRQLAQFALIFDDGFICEGTDTAFAAVKAGDTVRIRAYHDVRGWPVFDPEFWECEEAQLVELVKRGDG